MVRTHVGASAARFDVSRILAFGAAIALHLLALGMLLMPLSQLPIRADTPQLEARWIIPEPVRVTPPPPTDPVPVVTSTTPPPIRHALPVLLESAPLPVFATEAVISEAAVIETPATNASLAVPGTGTPLQGISLQYLSAPAPAYPREAVRTGAQGTVILRVLVDENGAPVEVSVERSSGNRSLDNAARSQVLRRWTFRPALDNGRAVQAYGLIPVDFKLD